MGRPEKRVQVWVEDTEFGEDFYVEVMPADLLAAVRAGVESGTIEGMEVETSIMRVGEFERRVTPIEYTKPGRYLVIPVSEGEERQAKEADHA